MKLSRRAQSLVSSPSPIMIGHMTCAQDPYSLTNPTGHLNFGTAENHLVDEFILSKINTPIEHFSENMHYSQLHGIDLFKYTVTNFLNRYLHTEDLKPENLIVQSGVSAVCEALSFALFDEGDYIIIPTPYYTGFDHDFKKRFKVNFLYADLNPTDEFTHHIEAFKLAYESCPEKDKIKAVLITDPHNPTGEVLKENFKSDIIKFCLDRDLSLISDEIYALSDHSGASHTSLFQQALSKKVDAHLLYGMAKDFALGGMKVGFYYSENQEIVKAMQDLSYFHPTSTSTQLLAHQILSDFDFLDKYIPEMQKRLRPIPPLISQQLPTLKFIAPEAALFMMLDLSKYCKSFDQEAEFFNIFLKKYKINISPGSDLGLKTPGFFRVCFAQKKEAVLEFIMRMKKFAEEEINQKDE